MNQQEIYNRLKEFRNRQIMLDADPNAEYFNSIMSDIARTLGLSDDQVAELAGDEIPDDLITITAASDVLGVTPNAVSNRIRNGSIAAYTDEEANNPRHARRVSRADIESLLSKPTRAIQHELAAMAREATGDVPRGQLWQPCERHDCDNEPVCMNCMKCEESHCKCFD